MPELQEIPILDISKSRGEQAVEKCQRKKTKLSKLSSSATKNSTSHIPRSNSAIKPSEFKLPLSFRKPKHVVAESQSSFRRLEKSFSQIDMKSSRNLHSSRFHRNGLENNNYGSVVLPKPVLQPIAYSKKDTSSYPTKDNGYFYMVNEPECPELGPKLAGMKIFATIMLNSWRNRRDEVKHLKEEIDRLERRAIKVKNQVHVLSSVFRNEQKQNEKLHRQLRHASQDIQTLQSSIENVTTSLISAKADSSFFEQQFHAKEQENESLNNIIVETNSQLFKSMSQVRQLQTSLSCEQRSVQQLENQKNELLNEIAVTEMKWKKVEEQHLIEIYQKEAELAKTNAEIKILETLLLDLKEKEFQVRDLKKSDLQLKNDIENLKAEAEMLKAELSQCLSARMKRFWHNYMELNHNTILLIHLGAFYLLPAVPPSKSLKLPFTVNLEKVINFIR